jgi:hypothetical protein
MNEAPTTTETPTPARKRRFRAVLSIRALILLVMLIGGGLGWMAHSARVQREAVAIIEQSGGNVQYDYDYRLGQRWFASPQWLIDAVGIDYLDTVVTVMTAAGDEEYNMKAIEQLPHLEWLTLDSSHLVTVAGPKNLERFSQLRYLDLFYAKGTRATFPSLKGLNRLEHLKIVNINVTDADLDNLAGMDQLWDLTIDTDSDQITDKGLAKLAALPALTSLTVKSRAISDAGLAHLARLNSLSELSLDRAKLTTIAPIQALSDLTTLSLRDCPITDVGLAPMAELKNLITLDVSGTLLSDVGLTHLRELTQVQKLSLSKTKITDAGLAQLSGLSMLSELDLSGTSVGDPGVAHLVGLKLVSLNLSDTKLTDAGLLQLVKAGPYRLITVNNTAVTWAGLDAAKRASPTTDIVARPPGFRCVDE